AAYGCLQTLPLPATPLPIGVTSPKSGCINKKKVSTPCWAHHKRVRLNETDSLYLLYPVEPELLFISGKPVS
ncbi:MAG: hypothetical protein RAP03_17510, partial [Candidatus Electryonea clarkiae]|nr:hypothetical protein [Candidatus Electryonea clarkiae]